MKLPKISEMITKILNDPITDQEIEKAIEELKVGKLQDRMDYLNFIKLSNRK